MTEALDETTDLESIGARLRSRRTEHGFSIRALAERADTRPRSSAKSSGERPNRPSQPSSAWPRRSAPASPTSSPLPPKPTDTRSARQPASPCHSARPPMGTTNDPPSRRRACTSRSPHRTPQKSSRRSMAAMNRAPRPVRSSTPYEGEDWGMVLTGRFKVDPQRRGPLPRRRRLHLVSQRRSPQDRERLPRCQ